MVHLPFLQNPKLDLLFLITASGAKEKHTVLQPLASGQCAFLWLLQAQISILFLLLAEGMYQAVILSYIVPKYSIPCFFPKKVYTILNSQFLNLIDKVKIHSKLLRQFLNTKICKFIHSLFQPCHRATIKFELKIRSLKVSLKKTTVIHISDFSQFNSWM